MQQYSANAPVKEGSFKVDDKKMAGKIDIYNLILGKMSDRKSSREVERSGHDVSEHDDAQKPKSLLQLNQSNPSEKKSVMDDSEVEQS